VRFDRVSPAPFFLDIGTTENLVLNMNGGDDTFSATGNLAALIKLTIDGGAGNDTILGGNGNDTLLGGDGNDFIDGNQGTDTAFLGAGDDTFQWDPGDGNDTVEGQAGSDTMLFNGSNIGEILDLSANGERVRLTRNIGAIVMDVNDVETVTLNTLGGADTVTIGDLSGTDVQTVNVNLGSTIGGTAGDALADTVIVNARNGGDNIQIVGAGTSVSVTGTGLPAVQITGSEGANDSLVVNGLGGNDTIVASSLPAGVIKLTLDGGAGNDTLIGSAGADTLLGGDGNDVIDGRQGNDVVLMGAGDDLFQWNPGDGSDTIDGEAGFDTMIFNGANISETVNIFANGTHALFTRDVANITMDLHGVERVDFNALGGADTIVVGDMSGTDVTQVNIGLASTLGGTAGDGAVDSVTVNGTQGADAITVGSAGDTIVVSGLSAQTSLFGAEATDKLTVNGQGGDDIIDASSLAAGKIALTLNGGLGNDIIKGSGGADLITGGDGNDFVQMGGGDDVFVWNPGDDNDTIDGQAGSDTMLFNGANIAENIDISANGDHARFFRDVANVTMDLDNVETIDFNAFGGADKIVVNDLSGTDVSLVNIDLAANGGGGDGQPDTVTVNATAGDDVILLSVDANGALVIDGLASRIVIEHFEFGVDTVQINGLGGADVIEASGVGANGPNLVLNGGDGDDVLVGSAGNDVILGGAGDDILIGNGGVDVLDGGPGDNVVIQGLVAGSFDALPLADQHLFGL
jgi:Ca2+-binding RTX toxin-like protein